MNIEIYYEEQLIDFEQVKVKNFSEKMIQDRENKPINDIDFSSIKMLVGDKDVMELCFQHTKKELV